MKQTHHGARYRTDLIKNLVGFQVGGVRYAIEIQRVREIVNPMRVVTLPHVPAEIVGVADHRGRVIPVVDLRIRFGLPPTDVTRRTKWLIANVRGEGIPVALVVDAVTEVFGAGEQSRREIPQLGGGDDRRGIARVYSHGNGLVFVVDPARVASATEALDVQRLAHLIGMQEAT